MMSARQMHSQVLILATAQALFQTASVLVMVVGGLAGAQIAASGALATAPIASMFLGTAVATFPASLGMARFGRRTGFVVGATLGAIGGVISALGVWLGSMGLLAGGTFLVGCYQGFAQFYRFAAAEVADDAYRPRAISLVLAGGIVAAVAGPWLGRVGGPLLAAQYAGSFLLLSLVSIVAAVVLLRLQAQATSGSAVNAIAEPRRWTAIVMQPAYLVALLGAATGYGVMILAMTATPIAMVHNGHDLTAASTVIQLHVLGMFVPSFFTGTLIARFGVLRIMFVGVLILCGHVLASLSGVGFYSFAAALVMLGVGWNFLYVGGTTLLTTTHTAVEKGRAQATNDMTIFAVGLCASLGAGLLLEAVGWQMANALLLPWLAVAAAALVWLGFRHRRTALAPAQ